MDPDEVEKIRFLVIPFSPVSFVVHNIDQLQERKLHYIGHVSRRGYEKNSKKFSEPAANWTNTAALRSLPNRLELRSTQAQGLSSVYFQETNPDNPTNPTKPMAHYPVKGSP